MKDRKLAVRYARALLSTLPDPNDSKLADDLLGALREAMHESAGFRELMLNPAVPRSERTRALARLAEQAGAPREVRNFLSTLVDNGRTGSIPSIAEVYREEREAAMGIVRAEITTATPMSEELEQRARSAVARMTGRQVRLTCKVEPTLLAGAVTRVGSTVYDGSLRTQLSRLRRKMTQE